MTGLDMQGPSQNTPISSVQREAQKEGSEGRALQKLAQSL